MENSISFFQKAATKLPRTEPDDTMKQVIPNVEPIMDEAINYLDLDVKREYLQALNEVPHLVARETPKDKFLRTCENHPWKAARRLALYWKFRKEIMTQERWLLPMTQTGDGTLGKEEIALLRCGNYNYSFSEETGPVVVVDCCRNQGFSSNACGRILFYLGTILDEPSIQTTGVTIIYAVTSADTESYINPRFGKFIAEGLPVKVRRFAVVENFEPDKAHLVHYLAERRMLQININYQADCDLIASQESHQDLIRMVEQAGLPSKALPKSCGGLFDDTVLSKWVRERISLEGILDSSSPTEQLRLLTQQRKRVRERTRRPKRKSISTGCNTHIDDNGNGNHTKSRKKGENDTPAADAQQKQKELPPTSLTLGLPPTKTTLGTGEVDLIGQLLGEVRQAMLKFQNNTKTSFRPSALVLEEDLDFGLPVLDPLEGTCGNE